MPTASGVLAELRRSVPPNRTPLLHAHELLGLPGRPCTSRTQQTPITLVSLRLPSGPGGGLPPTPVCRPGGASGTRELDWLLKGHGVAAGRADLGRLRKSPPGIPQAPSGKAHLSASHRQDGPTRDLRALDRRRRGQGLSTSPPLPVHATSHGSQQSVPLQDRTQCDLSPLTLGQEVWG